LITINPNNSIFVRNINSDGKINRALFMDKNNEVIGIFYEQTIKYFDFNTLEVLHE